jgi:hypothetical protein
VRAVLTRGGAPRLTEPAVPDWSHLAENEARLELQRLATAAAQQQSHQRELEKDAHRLRREYKVLHCAFCSTELSAAPGAAPCCDRMTATLTASFSGTSPPKQTRVVPGNEASVIVTLYNGDHTWPTGSHLELVASDAPFLEVGSHWKPGKGEPGTRSPQSWFALSIKVPANAKPGTYQLKLRMRAGCRADGSILPLFGATVLYSIVVAPAATGSPPSPRGQRAAGRMDPTPSSARRERGTPQAGVVRPPTAVAPLADGAAPSPPSTPTVEAVPLPPSPAPKPEPPNPQSLAGPAVEGQRPRVLSPAPQRAADIPSTPRPGGRRDTTGAAPPAQRPSARMTLRSDSISAANTATRAVGAAAGNKGGARRDVMNG